MKKPRRPPKRESKRRPATGGPYKVLNRRGGAAEVTVITTEHFTCTGCGQLVWQEGHSTAPLCPICHQLSEHSPMSPANREELRNYLGTALCRAAAEVRASAAQKRTENDKDV